MEIDARTAWTCLAMIAVGIFMGSIWGCSERAESERAKPASYDTRINPSYEEVTKLQQDHRPEATADDELVPTTCTWSETMNGFQYTCGPAHVDATDCNEGFTRVCVRRYGTRVCNCYPE